MIEALMKEIERNKALLPAYEQIGPVGNFATALIKLDIAKAEKALHEGNTVEMIRALTVLRSNKN